ncbi:hypothetical protein chiPu_0013437 [Chiloscyllium punctatum]|uniref:Uncharacterized protein n=1 Tax=Chiloscyllium punctatum TaxID=137246 RepID=A0A401SX64_CHIPU|nr:hypothetical protein [Chiloscyllium punctatum]
MLYMQFLDIFIEVQMCCVLFKSFPIFTEKALAQRLREKALLAQSRGISDIPYDDTDLFLSKLGAINLIVKGLSKHLVFVMKLPC